MDAFLAREARLVQPHYEVDVQRRLFKAQSTRALEAQPAFLECEKVWG